MNLSDQYILVYDWVHTEIDWLCSHINKFHSVKHKISAEFWVIWKIPFKNGILCSIRFTYINKLIKYKYVFLSIVPVFLYIILWNLGKGKYNSTIHYVKSVRIRSFPGPYFRALGLITGKYGPEKLQIQTFFAQYSWIFRSSGTEILFKGQFFE